MLYDPAVGDARHNFTARLIDARRRAEASKQSALAITAYKRAVSDIRAERARIVQGLTDLAIVLRNGGLDTEAADAGDATAALQTP